MSDSANVVLTLPSYLLPTWCHVMNLWVSVDLGLILRTQFPSVPADTSFKTIPHVMEQRVTKGPLAAALRFFWSM